LGLQDVLVKDRLDTSSRVDLKTALMSSSRGGERREEKQAADYEEYEHLPIISNHSRSSWLGL
jgi:hypothetical protein